MQSLLNLTATPESQETGDPPSTMSGWYAASREALRSGLPFLRDLKVETDEFGSVHLEDERWKGPIIRGFGLDIYNMLSRWKDLSPELLKLAVTLDAQQRNFDFPPFPCENNVVADPQLKLGFISKLVDLQIQHLVDLQRVQTAGLADESPRASAESYSRLMLEANSELRKAVDFFCYLVSAGL
jgi:hypothetical protein